METEHWIAISLGIFTVLGGFIGIGMLLLHLHKSSEKYFDSKYETMESKNETMRAELVGIINEKLGGLESKFEVYDAKFETLDARFNAIESRFNTIESKFDSIDAKIVNLGLRMDRIESNVTYLMDVILQLDKIIKRDR